MERKIDFDDSSFGDLSVEYLSNFDAIIHLGAITNAAASFKNREDLEYTNIVETKRLINNAEKSDAPLFIFPSSTSVYGKAKDVMYEDDDNVNPQSPYARSKVSIENHLKKTTKLNYAILRFGTIFGTSIGMRFHTAINKFCYQAAFDKKLTVWKENFHQYRPYLGLEDATQAIEIILKNESPQRQVYNVLTDNFKLSDIIGFIQEVKDVNIDFVDTPLLNQFSYYVNYDKMKDLGYDPMATLKTCIRDSIGLFDRSLEK
tara:strand:- start:5319 stop:6098 length:780 start_codon:yes stop_codon:yes gene_type:complete